MRPPEKLDHSLPVPSVVVIPRFDCTWKCSDAKDRDGRQFTRARPIITRVTHKCCIVYHQLQFACISIVWSRHVNVYTVNPRYDGHYCENVAGGTVFEKYGIPEANMVSAKRPCFSPNGASHASYLLP